MPLICVSLGIDDPQGLRDGHESLMLRGCRLAEYRLDYLPEGTDVAAVVRARPGPIIATVRRPEDGGRWTGDESRRRALLAACIDAGAEYVDLEPDAAAAISRRGTTRRIVSMHDFQGVPHDLETVHARLSACDADVVKLAVTARSAVDNLRVLRLVARSPIPTAGLCMGAAGAPSRVLGAKFGAPFSYAAASEATAVAPGQLSFDVLRDLYRYEAITRSTPVACVIGDPIGHSKSPLLHNRALAAAGVDGVYVAFRVAPDELDEFVRGAQSLGFRGLSVTIPHKEAVLRHVSRLEPAARAIGAVNTLVFEPDGAIAGCNTDESGALDALEAVAPVRGKQALVLGAGGAARGIIHGLIRRGAAVAVTNRSRARADELAATMPVEVVEWESRHAHVFDVLVNCTSVGMHPEVDATPFDAEHLPPGALVFDTVYNPVETRLLREAQARGCRKVVGTEMFVRQAARQFEMFFQAAAPLEAMRAAVGLHATERVPPTGPQSAIRDPRSEIAPGSLASPADRDAPLLLIGYRGTGKSTVARLLAARLGWDWVDADVEIERRAGKSIAAIFADDGEPRFRDLEADVLAELVARPRTVVACGGGAVVREANRKLLVAAPRVVWLRGSAEVLQRRIAADATTAARRPNLTPQGGSDEIETLLRRREPWYRECAKLTLDTDTIDPARAAAEVYDRLARERTGR